MDFARNARRFKWLFLLMLLLLVACQNTEPSASKQANNQLLNGNQTSPSQDQQLKIGFSMDTLLEERWQKDRDFFQAAVEKLGAKVEVFAANGNDVLQITQAETLLRNGADVLVVTPHDAETMATVVKKAHDAGVKVIAYDRLIKNSAVDLYISFDNQLVGELQANAIIQQVPRGNYVYIGGSETDHNAFLLKKGVYQVLQPKIANGDIVIVYDNWSANWSPKEAEAHMREAIELNGTDIDAVICANDATAGGALIALEEAGLAGKVPVLGQDAELSAIRRIVKGTQYMTVYKPIKLLAEKAASMAVQMARGEAVQSESFVNNGKIEVPAVLLKPIAVDANKIESIIIADGFHSSEQIYGVNQ